MYVLNISECQTRANVVVLLRMVYFFFFLNACQTRKDFFIFTKKKNNKWSSLNDRKLGQIEKLCR